MSESIDTEHIKFHRLTIVINRIKSLSAAMPQYMEDVMMRCMTDDIIPFWRQHIGLQDHSLEELAKLGHPYSRRFAVDSFIHPDSEVHEQSGSVMESTQIVADSVPGGRRVRLICTSPHWIFLRYGTRTMRMRDPAGVTMRDALPKIKARIHREIRGAIVEYMKS
jgi:hypothetical protein